MVRIPISIRSNLLSVLLTVCLFTPIARGKTAEKPLDRAPLEAFAVEQPSIVVNNPRKFSLVSDADTKILSFIIHVPFPEDPFLYDLLSLVRPAVNAILVVENREDADKVWTNLSRRKIAKFQRRIRFVVVKDVQQMSLWSRDSYTILTNPLTSEFALMRSHLNESLYYEEAPDQHVFDTLVNSNPGFAQIRRAHIDRYQTWDLEGGAITSDHRFAFMGHGSVAVMTVNKNEERVHSMNEVIRMVEEIMGKELVVMPAMDLHNDRYHIPIGKTKLGPHTSLLADPMKCLELIAKLSPEQKREAEQTIARQIRRFSEKRIVTDRNSALRPFLESRFDESSVRMFLSFPPDLVEQIGKSVEVQRLNEAERVLRSRGIAVVRVPVLLSRYTIPMAGTSDSTEIYIPFSMPYVNLIQDTTIKAKTVILPRFGIESIDNFVKNQVKSLGRFKKIHQINSVVEGALYGGPRCRVQVLGIPIIPDDTAN